MKKILIVSIAIVLSLFLASCGKNPVGTEQTNKATNLSITPIPTPGPCVQPKPTDGDHIVRYRIISSSKLNHIQYYDGGNNYFLEKTNEGEWTKEITINRRGLPIALKVSCWAMENIENENFNILAEIYIDKELVIADISPNWRTQSDSQKRVNWVSIIY